MAECVKLFIVSRIVKLFTKISQFTQVNVFKLLEELGGSAYLAIAET